MTKMFPANLFFISSMSVETQAGHVGNSASERRQIALENSTYRVQSYPPHGICLPSETSNPR